MLMGAGSRLQLNIHSHFRINTAVQKINPSVWVCICALIILIFSAHQLIKFTANAKHEPTLIFYVYNNNVDISNNVF